MPHKYTYPGSAVLRNRFGITDPRRAHQAETEAAHLRAKQLVVRPIEGDFDLAHLQAIHRFTLQDVYEWAGRIRDVDTGTTNTGLIHCQPEFIEAEAARVFGGIAADGYLRHLDHETFVTRLAYHWGELTALHPFLDGNTRTQSLFFDQLTRAAGWCLDWTYIGEHIDDFRQARLYAHRTTDSGPLADILRRAVVAPG